MQVFRKHRFACLMVAQAFEDCDPDAAGACAWVVGSQYTRYESDIDSYAMQEVIITHQLAYMHLAVTAHTTHTVAACR